MNWKKITLLCAALILIMPLLFACTKEMEDKAADDFINKLIGGSQSPSPTEVERYELNLMINLVVHKFPVNPNDSLDIPAYPQDIIFHIYRNYKGQIFDVQDIEKWTDKEGKISFYLLFKRVYIDDIISVSYKTKIIDFKYGNWQEKSEKLVTIQDIATNSLYDERNKRFNLSVSDEGWLSPILPATSSTNNR